MVSSGLRCCNDVLLVEGLIINLVCITQLCNQRLNVNFSKLECIVIRKDQEVLMKGLR